jgi:hypothetical protein
MPIAALLEFPASGQVDAQSMRENYERVSREFNNGHPMQRTSDWGPGFIAHTAGYTEGGEWWVVDVWEDQPSMDRFIAKMMPILQRQPDYIEPNVRVITVHNMVGVESMAHA